MSRLTYTMLATLWLASLAGAQGAPTLHDWIGLAVADGASIAPDGRSVAYITVTPDWAKDGFTRQIWIAASDGSSRRPLTDGTASSTTPRWSPDGRSIAFLSVRNGSTQVWLVSLPDGTPVQVTAAERGVDDFRWAPNGKQIAYLSGEPIEQPSPEPKEFHVVGNDGKSSAALWVVDLSANPSAPTAGTRVTDARAFAADDIAWSPDSKRIAFNASALDDPYPFWTHDIYVVDLETRRATRIVDTPGPDFFPLWSPDGKEIVYRTYVIARGDEYYTHSQGYLAAVPATGGPRRLLTDAFDEQATPVAWTADGIYFAARERTYQHLYRVDPTTKAITRLTAPFESIATGFSLTPDGQQVAFTYSDATHYQEIAVASVGPGITPRRITSMGDQLSKWTLASREVISWKSKDGLPIEGVLFKPPHFDPSRRHPLVVVVHGGPLAVDQPAITRDLPYAAEIYAQQGYLVLRPNYRGSVGYGAKFRAALVRNLGAPEYEDIVSGVDNLIHQGIVDSARVGLMGWSHGGYIAAFAATYGNRFAAVSVGAGVSDMRTFYSNGDGSTLKPSVAAPTPWDEPEYFRQVAPITYVKQARTPTLIQHGEHDNTAPISGARELYRALKDQGVPTKFVIYRGAGHLPSSLKQFEIVAQHNIEWFNQRLWTRTRAGAASGTFDRCVVPFLDTLATVCGMVMVAEDRAKPITPPR